MKNSKTVTKLAFVFLLAFQAPSAYAFDLIGGLLNAGVNAVGNIGHAAYNKVTEDSPEQAAAKQKKAEEDAIAAFRNERAKIEAQPGLTPLQREHAQIALNANQKLALSFLAANAEREKTQREANDKALSGAGIMGTLGSSLASGAAVAVSPTNPMNMSNEQLIAQGREIQRASQPAIDAAARQVAKGDTIAGTPGSAPVSLANAVATIDQRAAAMDKFEQQSGIADYRKLQQEMATREVDCAVTITGQDETPFAISQDKDRKVYAEFVGSPKLTVEIQNALRKSGFNVVDHPPEADVQYQFQGDYELAQTQGHTGTAGDAGEIFEGKAVPAPEKKSETAALARSFFGALAGMKIQKTPEDESFRQQVLIVVNRHAGGKDVRASSYVTGQSKEVKALGMVDLALLNLYAKVGLPNMDVSEFSQFNNNNVR